MCSFIVFTPCLSSFRPILTTDTTDWVASTVNIHFRQPWRLEPTLKAESVSGQGPLPGSESAALSVLSWHKGQDALWDLFYGGRHSYPS